MVHVSESELHFNFLTAASALWFRYRKAILIISAALLILPVLISAGRGPEPLYWPGWFVLRADPGIPPGIVEKQLEDAGVKDYVSAENSLVEYMDIPRIRMTSVSRIDDVLIPGDPRRDPYLSRIHELFESGDSSLVYLPSGPGLRYYREILRGMDGIGGWELMDDVSSPGGALAFIIFAGLALLTAFAARDGRMSAARIISILPPGLYLFFFFENMEVIFPLLLAYFLSPSNLIRQGNLKGRYYRGIVFSGYAASSGSGVTALLSALLSSELIVLLSPVREKHTPGTSVTRPEKRKLFRRRSEHQLFVPLSLTQHPRRTSGLTPKTAGLYLAAGCTLASLFLPAGFASQPEHSPIPHALPAVSDFDDLSSFTALDGERNASSLPDAAMMLSSAAFQEGFLFGSKFRLPLPGESLSIRGYSPEGSGLSVSETVVKNYDRSWYESVLQRELSRGAGLLFASLGGPSPVFRISQVPGIEETHLNRIQIALYGIAVLAMLLLTIFPYRGNAPVRSIYKPIINARRRAQAA